MRAKSWKKDKHIIFGTDILFFALIYENEFHYFYEMKCLKDGETLSQKKAMHNCFGLLCYHFDKISREIDIMQSREREREHYWESCHGIFRERQRKSRVRQNVVLFSLFSLLHCFGGSRAFSNEPVASQKN